MILFHGQPNDTDKIIYDVLKENAAVCLTFANCHGKRTSHKRLLESMPTPTEPFPNLETASPSTHFLDSGSYSLWTQVADQYAKEHGLEDRFAFYKTKKMTKYLDAYATFIKEHQDGIDLYANVDVIPNPELSWKNQQYLEKEHGLSPVPVVHFTTDVKWLSHYIERGYDLIALGGLVGSISQDSCQAWIDSCFELVCDTPDRKPCVKVHGFGLTSIELLMRYPWWSVDSTSWTKAGAYGGIYVPLPRGEGWRLTDTPKLIKVSHESTDQLKFDRHYYSMKPEWRKWVRRWLRHIGIPIGKFNQDGTIAEFGVTTRHIERRAANLLYFEKMRKSLPDWPWAWTSKRRKSFGVFK